MKDKNLKRYKNEKDKSIRTRKFKFGDIFIDNDDLVSKDKFSKQKRRYVVSGISGETNITVKKIKKLKGKEKDIVEGNLFPIDIDNPTIKEPSGISRQDYSHTYKSGKKERLKEKHIKNNPAGRLKYKDLDTLRKISKKKKHSD